MRNVQLKLYLIKYLDLLIRNYEIFLIQRLKFWLSCERGNSTDVLYSLCGYLWMKSIKNISLITESAVTFTEGQSPPFQPSPAPFCLRLHVQ